MATKTRQALHLAYLKDPRLTLVELLKQYSEPQIRGAMIRLLDSVNTITQNDDGKKDDLAFRIMHDILHKMLWDIIRGNTNMSDTVVSQLHHYTK